MLEQLLDNLNSRDKVLREDAERRLRALTPEELLQFSELENARFQKWSKVAWVKITAATLISVVVIFALLSLLPNSIGGKITGGLQWSFWWILGGWVTLFRHKQQPYTRYALAAAIQEREDLRVVPILLTMNMGVGSAKATKEAIDAALVRLLPGLRAEDTSAWTPEQCYHLWESLTNPLIEFPVSMTVLRMLKQYGSVSEAMLKRVRKLTQIKTKYTWSTRPKGISAQTANERAAQIKQAAQECLPFLEQRQQETAQAQTLLRASTLTTSPDTLLRAANAAPATENAEQLLRAGGKP